MLARASARGALTIPTASCWRRRPSSYSGPGFSPRRSPATPQPGQMAWRRRCETGEDEGGGSAAEGLVAPRNTEIISVILVERSALSMIHRSVPQPRMARTATSRAKMTIAAGPRMSQARRAADPAVHWLKCLSAFFMVPRSHGTDTAADNPSGASHKEP